MSEILEGLAVVILVLLILGGLGFMTFEGFTDGPIGMGFAGGAMFLIVVCAVGAGITGDWKTNTVSIEVTDQGCYRSEMVGKITRHIETTCPRDLSR